MDDIPAQDVGVVEAALHVPQRLLQLRTTMLLPAFPETVRDYAGRCPLQLRTTMLLPVFPEIVRDYAGRCLLQLRDTLPAFPVIVDDCDCRLFPYW